MKRLLFIFFSILSSQLLFAEHITGGEIFYTYLGRSGADYNYRITMKLFRDCASNGAQLDKEAGLAIFDRSTNLEVLRRMVPMTSKETLLLRTPGPCITNAPSVCYEVGYYQFDVTLGGSAAGYTIAYQRCCRIQGVSNLINSGNQGATYTAEIPGTTIRPDGPQNNSAKFVGVDTVIVCGGYPFSYSFAASDPDSTDQLRYSFCDAFQGGSTGAASPYPPSNPPYNSVSYGFGYVGSKPLGTNVNINPLTGLITGTSPDEGIYVVTVCVTEIRNGLVIATQRKDLQIKAGGCDIAKAQLDPVYLSCDGFTVDFANNISSPLIKTYYWEFGDQFAAPQDNSSTLEKPSHTYTVANDYQFKLVTNRGQECSDSATATVKVYPGFFPKFATQGTCYKNPVQFIDQSTTAYGVVNSWKWNFGDPTATNDTSLSQNPSWKYPNAGNKIVSLTVTSSKGCSKEIKDTVAIIDKPPIRLAFRDTLMCIPPDKVTMHASGNGTFSWTPTTNMVDANTPDPTVDPPNTTTYHVTLDDAGCLNTDSVRIRVVKEVTLKVMDDTTICRTDRNQLRVESDGLRYQWSPASAFLDATAKNPIAIAGTSNTYQVIARIGSCFTTGSVNVKAVPYPVVKVRPDTTICYNTSAGLYAEHDGSSFSWSPLSTLINGNTLMPTAYPARTTGYIFTSTDTKGCPKPTRDTVLVTVLPKIIPDATNDTMVVVGQPLQLNAEGGVRYEWMPPTGLNNSHIKNPIGNYPSEIDSVRYTVQVYNRVGCYDSTFVSVKVFKTNPYVFVPTAFTPNGDGLNDRIMPIAVGVQKINYFNIYNRWGELLFSTTSNGYGWDGKIGGVPQASNVFVWMVNAVDYLGKSIFIKGTVTLIR